METGFAGSYRPAQCAAIVQKRWANGGQLAGGPCERLASFHGSVACDSDRRGGRGRRGRGHVDPRDPAEGRAASIPSPRPRGRTARSPESSPTGAVASLNSGEALRRFVAYALDDAPREALSRPPDPDHAPVFTAVQKILERIEARPEYIPRRPSLLPKLLATVNDNEATHGRDVAHHRAGSGAHRQPAAHREQPDLSRRAACPWRASIGR